jgi:DNA helicase-2/ATP-dependent DNA helicase PcrA
MNNLNLNSNKLELLRTSGHLLAIGGPGSGKTTISILKANKLITDGFLLPKQKILFLSFARATIGRVAELAGNEISNTNLKHLEIETYHGFAWKILKSHGYLINKNSPLKLLPPPQAGSLLAGIKDKNQRYIEKCRLFDEEGLLHFDLFAKKAKELLLRSNALTHIICNKYPIIILDEFQDTNGDEWSLIKQLGEKSCLIALADAEQRIYDFRGANPKRISEFISEFSPMKFDFGGENNRSNGTDIALFGNELLNGSNKGKQYKNVKIIQYPFIGAGNGKHLNLKLSLLQILNKLKKSDTKDWSIGILVPTKNLMLEISDFIGSEQNLSSGKSFKPISHDVAIETSGPSLAAILIARLMEVGTLHGLILDLCEYIKGCKGDTNISQANLNLCEALSNYLRTGKISGKNRLSVVNECNRIVNERIKIEMTGNPESDWIKVRKLLLESTSPEIRNIGEDAKHLRFLNKGAIFRTRLGELWRKNGNYTGITSAVQNALVQEHFTSSNREMRGIYIMTIHKSKGKEFTEVIIYEDNHQARIERFSPTSEDTARSRLLLRVGVTRAMQNTTILTPQSNPCRLL